MSFAAYYHLLAPVEWNLSASLIVQAWDYSSVHVVFAQHYCWLVDFPALGAELVWRKSVQKMVDTL